MYVFDIQNSQICLHIDLLTNLLLIFTTLETLFYYLLNKHYLVVKLRNSFRSSLWNFYLIKCTLICIYINIIN